MDEDFIVIRNEQPKPKNKKYILIVAGAVLLLVTFIIVWLLNRGPKLPDAINIINYDSVKEFLPEGAKQEIELSLYYHLKQYFEVPEEKDSVEVEIRTDTYEKVNNNNNKTNTVKFVVDIDSFEQTYMIIMGWSDAYSDVLLNILIGCPAQETIKYEGAECHSENKLGGFIWASLPYRGEISSGEEFTVRQREYFNGEKYLEIAINSCGDENILKEALELTKKWIQSKGIDPEELKYEIPNHYCPGGAS